jgi:lipoprotein-releasing system permease protein
MSFSFPSFAQKSPSPESEERMFFEFFITLRHLRAKRKQFFVSLITLLSVIGVAVGVMALIVVLAVMTGFEEDITSKIVGMTAHVVVRQHGKVGLKDYRAIAEQLEEINGVAGASPFIINQVMLTTKVGITGAVLRGIDPETIGYVTSLIENIKHGSVQALSRSEPPGIIVGSELSKTLGVSVGHSVNVVTPMGTMTPMGMVPKREQFQVVGIFTSGYYDYDTSFAYISISEAQRFFNIPDVVSGIEVRVEDVYRAREVASRIEKRLGFPFWTMDWMAMNRNFFKALKMERIAMFIILTLIVFVAALAIVTTLIMVVMEKTREIAILKSMGATTSSIMRIFIIEGLVIGVVGTIVGTVLGLAIAFNLEPITHFLESVFRFKFVPGDVYYIDELPSTVRFLTVASIDGIAILLGFLATLYPSWKAAKLDPVEALRYE